MAADIPDELGELVRQAGPVRIVMVDVEAPLPDLRSDDQYHSAWIVLRRGGVCRRGVSIDLNLGPVAARAMLERSIVELASAPPEPDRPVVADDELPRISVVIPTVATRTEDLERCLDSLEHLDYPNFEVILVDNRPATPESPSGSPLGAGRSWLRVVRETRPGISAARNAGLVHATGQVIAFSDDDARVEPHWLRAIGTRMAGDPGLDVVTGLILPSELETPAQVWFERYYGGFNGPRSFTPLTLAVAPTRGPLRCRQVLVRDLAQRERRRFSIYGLGAYCAGANMAFRVPTLRRIGGFDVALGAGTPTRGGEDLAAIITVLSRGGTLGYEPAAVVHHRHRRTYAELLRLMDGNGTGFTAMLSSLIRTDPRHLLCMTIGASHAVGQLGGQWRRRISGQSTVTPASSTTTPQFPADMVRREFRAYLRGPLRYRQSRSAQRRFTTHLE